MTMAAPTLAADVSDSKHSAPVARGKYLVTFGGCTDCHTPGTFTKGKPDTDKFLAGSDFAFNLGPADWWWRAISLRTKKRVSGTGLMTRSSKP
jgi:hypothetical protein